MLFCRVYIKNYLANYNSYFPLKVKGLILEKYLYTCTETLLELVFLINFVLSQNPITQRKFKTDESFSSKVSIYSGHLYDIFTNYIDYLYIYCVKKLDLFQSL